MDESERWGEYIKVGKAGEMWYLKVNGKSIKAFESWGAPVAEAKKYMKENNIPGVAILKRLGRSGEYTITAKDSKIRSINKAILICDEEYKYDKNDLLLEIRQRLREEYEAINSYLSMVERVDQSWIVDIIRDIAKEEQVHVGELEDILYKLNPEELKKVKEGMEENG